MLKKLSTDYGMFVVLLGLVVLFSALTLKEQMLSGTEAVNQIVEEIESELEPSDVILVVGAQKTDSALFAERVGNELKEQEFSNTEVVIGIPRDLRLILDELQSEDKKLAAIAATGDVIKWRVLEIIPDTHPEFSDFQLLTPSTHVGSDFLKRSNLLAVVDRIVVIAVIAIGMTMVIITAGIDLSVGSLLALSAVIATFVMKRLGGIEASVWVVLLGFIIGILGSGVIGSLGGFLVAKFNVAPFITTLAVMMMARGLAFQITGGFSIYQVPDALTWLGQGRSLGLPNTVVLLLILYTCAHIFMSHTRMGRYIYAVGGNKEAARLSGVPINLVIIFVYTVSALAAGLGGCIQASQINSGTPNMGMMYELYVIAAVVVGGTSLSGGTGRIFGTLIGAFIISVIQNGMNLLGLESYTQQVVLGAVILLAVLLDKVRGEEGLQGLIQRKFQRKLNNF